MREAHERHGSRLVNRICTLREAAALVGRDPALGLASIFALKEAVMKALGTGMRGVGWKEIDTTGGPVGTVEALVTGRALEVARSRGARSYSSSVTTSPDVVLAAVLLT